MKIDDIRDADEIFPFPTPGRRSMTDMEMDMLRARMLRRQQAPGVHTSVGHVPLPPIVL